MFGELSSKRIIALLNKVPIKNFQTLIPPKQEKGEHIRWSVLENFEKLFLAPEQFKIFVTGSFTNERLEDATQWWSVKNSDGKLDSLLIEHLEMLLADEDMPKDWKEHWKQMQFGFTKQHKFCAFIRFNSSDATDSQATQAFPTEDLSIQVLPRQTVTPLPPPLPVPNPSQTTNISTQQSPDPDFRVEYPTQRIAAKWYGKDQPKIMLSINKNAWEHNSMHNVEEDLKPNAYKIYDYRWKKNCPGVTKTKSGHPFIPYFGHQFMLVEHRWQAEAYFGHEELQEMCRVMDVDTKGKRWDIVLRLQEKYRTQMREHLGLTKEEFEKIQHLST